MRFQAWPKICSIFPSSTFLNNFSTQSTSNQSSKINSNFEKQFIEILMNTTYIKKKNTTGERKPENKKEIHALTVAITH